MGQNRVKIQSKWTVITHYYDAVLFNKPVVKVTGLEVQCVTSDNKLVFFQPIDKRYF